MDHNASSSSWTDATEPDTVFAAYEQPSGHRQEDSSQQQYQQHAQQDYAYTHELHNYLEPVDGNGSAGDLGQFEGTKRYSLMDGAQDASFSGYTHNTMSSRSLSNGSSSPALPALSPPSTAGSSWDSSPTSLHSPYALSPSLLAPHSPTKPISQHPSYLLPSVDIYDQTQRDAPGHEGSSPFAHAQDAYLQQHSQSYSIPTTPTRNRTTSEGVPTSTTPRGTLQHAHSYRSPGPGYSPSSSPSKSPYARSRTPVGLESPSRGYLQRSSSHRSPTKEEHLTYESPSKRRQSHLSIDVPPYQPRSPSRNRQQPQQLDSTATSGFEIVGEVQLEASQEMEQLLGQLDSFLGPDALCDSPMQAPRPAPTMHRAATFGAPQVVFSEPGPSLGSNDTFGGPIDISGVRLNPEDMSMLDEPEFDYDHRQYPASAPAWQTTFNLPSLPHQRPPHVSHFTSTPLSPHYASQQYTSAPLAPPLQLSHSYQNGPLSAPLRPRSTPLDESFSGSMPPPSYLGRRRSSVDDFSSLSAPQSYAQGPAYAYDSSIPQSSSHLYARPVPTHRHTYSPSPSASSSISSASSPPALKRQTSVRSSPTKAASPRKTRTSPTKKKAQPMFVNFSATDSKKLLSGVAPSGSSKRRREEQEAAAAAAAAAAAVAAQA